ncbi:MAG: MMPL family transporter [Verrucomicrobia bacterium]|nr:MMPL family transporter [Verrucomicrobiota bacterium]
MRRRSWWWLLLVVPLGLGLVRLRFDADILNLLPELPAVRGLKEHQRYFPNAGELWLTVRATNSAAASQAAEAVATTLNRRPDLVRRVRWQPPWKENPQDAADNLAWLWLQQPPEAVRTWLAARQPDTIAAELTRVQESLATELNPEELLRTSYDPLGLSRLPSGSGLNSSLTAGTGTFQNEAGTFRVLWVEPTNPRMNYREASAWLADVQSVSRQGLTAGSVPATLGYTGRPVFIAEISSGMERDLRNSVATTVVLIGVLFWWAHRSWKPLGWLLVSLGLILVVTLALGGLALGTLNVVSVGFAAVLLGLAVDYGLVSYQEAVAMPGATPAEVRKHVARGIWYSAITTAGTFLMLGGAGLPGLAQLGQLTALGLLVGAVVMLYFFLPRVCPVTSPLAPLAPPDSSQAANMSSLRPTVAVLGLILLVALWGGLPPMTTSDDPLRPRNSSAYAALDEARAELGRTREPWRLLFRGSNSTEVAEQLTAASLRLAEVQSRGTIESFDLPLGFWPRPDWAGTNRTLLRPWLNQQSRWEAEVLQAGFTGPALDLARGVWKAWPAWFATDVPDWPTNETARWLTGQFAARTDSGDVLALGAVWPGTNALPSTETWGLPDSVKISSWDTLAARLAGHVQQRVLWVTTLIIAALVFFLWMAFRNWREVALGLAALAVSIALLLAVMTLTGRTWNLLSLVALPLLLGSSVDSTIHLQLALRRHRGNRAAVWRTTGRALLLCAGANIAGFGSLAWSSNLGLASLDLVCATGVACVLVVCVGLLPAWWQRWAGTPAAPPAAPASPSALYGATAWRWGQRLGRWLPESVTVGLASLGALAYRRLRPERFEIVVANLQPVVGSNPGKAESAARANFQEFAHKLVDLWRYEAGVPMDQRIHPAAGWEHFSAALQSGRGVLLVTPHLGNWEFGAPLLRQFGQRPLVLTAPEPGDQFTDLRAAARARLGIDTLVVGEDPFAFVEVIRRLQDGGVVALLVDRPPAATAVEVTFLGRPFRASIAVAELARASGAVVLPVYLVRGTNGYRAHALPPIAYDRRQLGDRASRVAFTGDILRAFEPVVRQFPDQWFHFVPVWESKTPGAS